VEIAEEASEDEDEETSRRPRVGIRFGSCVNFRSILADALKGRKGLKEERRRTSLRSARCCYALSVSSSESEREYSCAEEDEETPAQGDVGHHVCIRRPTLSILYRIGAYSLFRFLQTYYHLVYHRNSHPSLQPSFSPRTCLSRCRTETLPLPRRPVFFSPPVFLTFCGTHSRAP
jgi:hypothetical protein